VSRRAGEARLFVDLFRQADDNADPVERVVSADSALSGLVVEIDRDGIYVLRLQPELLRAVRYTLTVLGAPSLGMPVEGAGNQDIKSRFGVERDAGRRQHEGIDVFAPRGTPVIAAAQGRIVDVGRNQLGGNVIWQWDPARNQNLYYAHLDRQLAVEGQQVEKGDTIGLVGNTGNARTTAPHLHFGIYPRNGGAIDPLPFVYHLSRQIDKMAGDTAALGAWVRVERRQVALSGLRSRPDTAPAIRPGTVLRVIGASGSRYRVELADGRQGFVSVSAVLVTRDSGPAWERLPR
jgi:murein DD-endopeptidase MepM/ murein hydrolase activator NlpD